MLKICDFMTTWVKEFQSNTMSDTTYMILIELSEFVWFWKMGGGGHDSIWHNNFKFLSWHLSHSFPTGDSFYAIFPILSFLGHTSKCRNARNNAKGEEDGPNMGTAKEYETRFVCDIFWKDFNLWILLSRASVKKSGDPKGSGNWYFLGP